MFKKIVVNNNNNCSNECNRYKNICNNAYK